jgi:hypothetical protein
VGCPWDSANVGSVLVFSRGLREFLTNTSPSMPVQARQWLPYLGAFGPLVEVRYPRLLQEKNEQLAANDTALKHIVGGLAPVETELNTTPHRSLRRDDFVDSAVHGSSHRHKQYGYTLAARLDPNRKSHAPS